MDRLTVGAHSNAGSTVLLQLEMVMVPLTQFTPGADQPGLALLARVGVGSRHSGSPTAEYVGLPTGVESGLEHLDLVALSDTVALRGR